MNTLFNLGEMWDFFWEIMKWSCGVMGKRLTQWVCGKAHLCGLMTCYEGLFCHGGVFKITCFSQKPFLLPALHLNLHRACVCGNCVGTFSWKERRGCVDHIGAREVMIQQRASRNYPLIDLLGDNLIPPTISSYHITGELCTEWLSLSTNEY